ncbi:MULTISPECIES: DUF262 domain-containing protein [unclassified Campylobacter]|uniref:DUF262 domain-containing protein n=1 Tax=unclassified Campylobacter TaxID=2593542 RepID=UPI001D20213E|nr:DUF262 domain-containing protein [Campylobacter sp. RM12647]MBZ7993293.1 DUF262 domain-containing protein [Campylobacter sp. RM9333]
MSEIKSGIKFNLSDENPVGSNVSSFSALASELELSIPDYQRPYVWEIKQTRMLLKDIENTKDGALLGSIILHEIKRDNKTIYEVIDGQQRLTTIKLILMALGKYEIFNENQNRYSNYLSNVSFFHKISQDNIKTNYEYIKNYLSNEDKAKDFLKKLEKTQFIIVATTNADDAFIFFDNTNSKGKKLESYDLIKAFHLQSLSQKSTFLEKNEARYFEKLIKQQDYPNSLDISYFINSILTPIRLWTRGKKIYKGFNKLSFAEFCKEDLDNISKYDNGIMRDFAIGSEFFEYFRKYAKILEYVKSLDFLKDLNNPDIKSKVNILTGVRMCLVAYIDKFNCANFDYVALLITRAVYSQRIVEGSISCSKNALDVLKIIHFSTYESDLANQLELFIEKCYQEEKNKHEGAKRKESKKYLKEIREKYEKYGILGHYLGEQNGTK